MMIDDKQIWGAFIALAGVIATLAKVLWSLVSRNFARLEEFIAQEKRRGDLQATVIERLQEEVRRMAKGCGFPNCLWRGRE